MWTFGARRGPRAAAVRPRAKAATTAPRRDAEGQGQQTSHAAALRSPASARKRARLVPALKAVLDTEDKQIHVMPLVWRSWMRGHSRERIAESLADEERTSAVRRPTSWRS